MITGPQIKAARALLGLDQKTLAERAGLSVPTIQRMEASEGTVGGTVESMTRVMSAIEVCGVDLIGERAVSESGGRGVRLRHPAAGETANRPADTRQGTK